MRLFNISVCDFIQLGRRRTAGSGVSAIARFQRMVWPAFMIFCYLVLPSAKGNPGQNAAASAANEKTALTGMVWIPGGEFILDTDDVRSFPNEGPAHKVQIEGFGSTNTTLRTQSSRNARVRAASNKVGENSK